MEIILNTNPYPDPNLIPNFYTYPCPENPNPNPKNPKTIPKTLF